MNALVPAASDRLERRLEAILTSAERLRIALDLGSAALAGGLLLVAFLFQWFGDPAQRPLVELFKGVAALIVSAPSSPPPCVESLPGMPTMSSSNWSHWQCWLPWPAASLQRPRSSL